MAAVPALPWPRQPPPFFHTMSSKPPVTFPASPGAAPGAPVSTLNLISAEGASRRRLIHRFAVLGAAVAAAGLVDDGVGWRRLIADHRTDVGQQEVLRLEGGTMLMMNTRTAVDVTEAEGGLQLRLVQGEVQIQHQTGTRPLQVLTSQGRIDSNGARLTIRRLGSDTTVNLLSGRATVTTAGSPAHRQALVAGQRLVFDRAHIQPVTVISEPEIAWIDRQILARNMKLADFVDELQRYSIGRLACDPAVAGLRVTGRFPLGDVQQVMHWLTTMMPLQVDVQGRQRGSPSLMIRAIG